MALQNSIKEFNYNSSYVFSRRKYLESRKLDTSKIREWVTKGNNTRVEVILSDMAYLRLGDSSKIVYPEWCEEVK